MKKGTFYSVLFGFFTFATLNIPSIKIFYPSELVNLFIFSSVWIVGVARVLESKRILLPWSKKYYLMLFTLVWLIMMLCTFLNFSPTFGDREFVQYTVVILFVIGITVFVEFNDVYRVIKLQVYWASLLSILQLMGSINLSRDLGQHYLTLGMPIAAGIICASGLFMFRGKRKVKVFSLIAIALNVNALISLEGRTPVILAISIPILTVIISLFINKGISRKLKGFFYLVFAGLLLIVFRHNASEQLLYRFEKLIHEENPRLALYDVSINIIQNNPFGTGLNSSEFTYGYPHNIFLEIGISGGIIAMVVFLFLVVYVLFKWLKSFKINSQHVTVGSLALFFLLTWSISFDLVSGYIPFAAMALAVVYKNNNIKTSETHSTTKAVG